MTRIQELDRFQFILKKLFTNKDNEFTMITKNKVYMKVHMYPYILEKRIQNNETNYSMKLMY